MPTAGVGLVDQRPLPIGIVTLGAGRTVMTDRTAAPDGRPMVGPFDRAGWRAWLDRAPRVVERRLPRRRGVGAPGGPACRTRRPSRRPCASAGSMSLGRTIDERAVDPVVRAAQPGQRLGALEQGAGRATDRGRADVAGGHRRGRGGQAQRHLDVARRCREPLVPDDLAAALEAHPPARAHWDAFSRSRAGRCSSGCRGQRPETRAKRIAEAADHAARNEAPPQFRPRD